MPPQLPPSTVLVTGANGFVGARTCAALATAGAQVRALVRREGTAPAHDGVTEHVAGYEREELVAALDGAAAVVHVAAAAGPDVATAAQINVDGTRLLAEVAAEAGIRRFVHVSTQAVVADGQPVVTEDAALVGDDAGPYALTKRQGEEALAEVADATGLELVVLRPPTVQGWGPSSTWGEKVPSLYGEGETPMQPDPRAHMGWVHVDDLADALVLAVAADEAPSRVYNVGMDATWGAYFDVLAGWYPDAPPLAVPDADPPAPSRLVSDRVRRELGWSPSRTFEEGLAEAAPHHLGG